MDMDMDINGRKNIMDETKSVKFAGNLEFEKQMPKKKFATEKSEPRKKKQTTKTTETYKPFESFCTDWLAKKNNTIK